MSGVFGDIRFAGRMLRRNPGFTILTIVTLAIAIGANTAMFSVISALLLRPFPYRNPEQLVNITVKDEATEFGGTLLRYELLRDKAHRFESVAAWAMDDFNLTGFGEPEQVAVARVTPNFFSVLGVKPQLGRVFTAKEGQPEGMPAVILSNAIWQSHFRGDRGILGHAITLDGIPHTVVGVLSSTAKFPFLSSPDVWTPRYFEHTLISPQRLRMGVGYLGLIARMRRGTTVSQCNAELAFLNRRYRDENPAAPDGSPSVKMTAAPLRDLVVSDVRPKLWILSCAAGLFFLIGCGNVASLLLARVLARTKELAVRAAMGASRSAILRLLLTEIMLLVVAACVFGGVIARVVDDALTAWGAAQLPQDIPIQADVHVLLFTIALALITGIVTGLFPAIQLSGLDLNSAIRVEGRGLSQGGARKRLRELLVVGQVALSLLLLICAGLLLHSFERLLTVNPGFEPHNVLTMEIPLATASYPKPEQQIAFFNEALRRISQLPGVRAAAISATLPLTVKRITPVLPQGQPELPLAQRPFVDIEAISPRWFDTMRVPLLAGRPFTAADNANSHKVVIVNKTFARRFWPGENPVGKGIVVGRGPRFSEVVGMAADIRNKGLAQKTQPQLYLPFAQLPWSDMNLLVRTVVPPLSLASEIRGEILAVNPDQPITHVQTVDDLMDSSRSQPRFVMLIMTGFSVMALALAAIGLYAALAWSVTQRRTEIGIRMAVGADRRQIRWSVVKRALLLAVSGIGIGLAVGLALTNAFSGILYEVSTRDLATFVVAPFVMVAIAALACYVPARRATEIDPAEMLKTS